LPHWGLLQYGNEEVLPHWGLLRYGKKTLPRVKEERNFVRTIKEQEG